MKSCLYIDISLREHRSILKSVYATTPYKLADITENKKGGALELMIMSNSPGILDGDEHELRVNLQAGTFVNLHTQSYQRLFNMKQSASLALTVCGSTIDQGKRHCTVCKKNAPHRLIRGISLCARRPFVTGLEDA